MFDRRFAELYRQMLVEVGSRSDDLGSHVVASHWPFVGSRFGGTLIVGQALAGWDAEDTSARWDTDLAKTESGRQRIIDGSRAWATARTEPMEEVLRWGHRRRSPFWGLSERLMRLLEPTVEPWYSAYAWWNVYPLGWDHPGRSPGPKLRSAQAAQVGDLFWEVVGELRATRVIIVSGADWWPDVRERLSLGTLERRAMPILAAGRQLDATLVATYHPGAHIKGLTRDAFAARIAAEIKAVEDRAA